MGINLNNYGYDNVPAAESGEEPTYLPPDGYICRICHAEFALTKSEKRMLVLQLDIAEGDFAGYFTNRYNRNKKFNPDAKWPNPAIYRQMILDSAGKVSSYFKGLLTCIQKSNKQFLLNQNNFSASDLRGLKCGFVFAQEEYQKRDNSIATLCVVKFPKNVDDILDGNFTVPPLKQLSPKPQPTTDFSPLNGAPIDNFDTPF